MDVYTTMRSEATQLSSGLLYLKRDIPQRERTHLMIWQPKAKKPYFNYLVKPEQVEKTLLEASEQLLAHKKSVEERREKRKPTQEKMQAVEIGQIYYTSWGYDQTNIDFYQVTTIKNAMVGLTPIRSTMVDQYHGDYGNVIGLKDEFKGKEFFKKANFTWERVSFTITSFSNASLWDGTPRHCSWGR